VNFLDVQNSQRKDLTAQYIQHWGYLHLGVDNSNKKRAMDWNKSLSLYYEK